MIDRKAARLPKLTEAQFQAQVLELASLNGWLAFHHFDSRKTREGWPDLVLIRHAVIFAELKVPPRLPTPAQALTLERLRAAGQRAFLWRPEDWPEIQRVLTERG